MIRSAWTALLVTVVSVSAAFAQQRTAPSPPADELSDFAKQILVPDLDENEKDTDLQSRPEIFVQTRFSRGRVSGAAPEDAVQSFEITRIETRWAGRLSDRVGAGLELQFHPALERAAEELVNDAFVAVPHARAHASRRPIHQAVRIRCASIERRARVSRTRHVPLATSSQGSAIGA